MGYWYIGGTVLFTVYGQLILKWRIGNYGALPDGFLEKLIFLTKLLLDGYILSGLAAAFVASLFWMAVMTEADLSFAYPIIVAGLMLCTSLAAVTILGESITATKLIGFFLIIAGVFIMHSSAIDT